MLVQDDGDFGCVPASVMDSKPKAGFHGYGYGKMETWAWPEGTEGVIAMSDGRTWNWV